MGDIDFPEAVADLIGKPMFSARADGPVEAGAIRLFAAAVEDAHPDCWHADPARVIAPPALVSAWNRPLAWVPASQPAAPGLALHFLVKERLGLPLAVVIGTETEVANPVRPGMVILAEQVLLSVSAPRSNRLGEGRNWTIRIDYRCADSGQLLGAETLVFFGYGERREA